MLYFECCQVFMCFYTDISDFLTHQTESNSLFNIIFPRKGMPFINILQDLTGKDEYVCLYLFKK